MYVFYVFNTLTSVSYCFNQCKKVNRGNVERLYPIPKGEEKGYGKIFFYSVSCAYVYT